MQRKTPAQKLQERLIEKGFDAFIYESPIDKIKAMMARGENAIELWEDGLIPYDESPSTGDVSGERVAVIGAVSLACIIPAACLMRRRRRNTF